MKIKKGNIESRGHQLAYLAVNTHLLRDDEEPVVVFIHGVLASVNFWKDCVPPAFRNNKPWYSLSLPAHSPSTVPDDFTPEQVTTDWFNQVLNGALKNLLGNKKAIIIGHSTGGFCALNLATHHAPNVSGVISVGGFHRGEWGGLEGLLVKLAGLGGWARGPFVAGLAMAQHSSLLQHLFTGTLSGDMGKYLSNPLSQRLLENILPDIKEQNYEDLFPLFRGINYIDITDDLKKIRVPCYIFAGTKDPVIPMEQTRILSAKIPGAKTVLFQDVGHMPFIEATRDYFDELEKAIAVIKQQ